MLKVTNYSRKKKLQQEKEITSFLLKEGDSASDSVFFGGLNTGNFIRLPSWVI